MFGGQFQLNLDKSDVENVNNRLPLSARLARRICGDVSIYRQIKNSMIINIVLN